MCYRFRVVCPSVCHDLPHSLSTSTFPAGPIETRLFIWYLLQHDQNVVQGDLPEALASTRAAQVKNYLVYKTIVRYNDVSSLV